MTDSWEYEKLVENQDDLARAMGANKGIALSVATKLVAKKVVSEAAKELADVRGPDVTERLRATSVINIVLEEIKADPTVYYVFREALLSAGLTNGVVNKWMPAKPGATGQ